MSRNGWMRNSQRVFFCFSSFWCTVSQSLILPTDGLGSAAWITWSWFPEDQNTQTLNGALAFVPFILQQARYISDIPKVLVVRAVRFDLKKFWKKIKSLYIYILQKSEKSWMTEAGNPFKGHILSEKGWKPSFLSRPSMKGTWTKSRL